MIGGVARQKRYTVTAIKRWRQTTVDDKLPLNGCTYTRSGPTTPHSLASLHHQRALALEPNARPNDSRVESKGAISTCSDSPPFETHKTMCTTRALKPSAALSKPWILILTTIGRSACKCVSGGTGCLGGNWLRQGVSIPYQTPYLQWTSP